VGRENKLCFGARGAEDKARRCQAHVGGTETVAQLRPRAATTVRSEPVARCRWARSRLAGRSTRCAFGILPGGPWAKWPRASLTGWAGTAPTDRPIYPFVIILRFFNYQTDSNLQIMKKVLPEFQKFPNLQWV
jgi:hypothetical protein